MRTLMVKLMVIMLVTIIVKYCLMTGHLNTAHLSFPFGHNMYHDDCSEVMMMKKNGIMIYI